MHLKTKILTVFIGFGMSLGWSLPMQAQTELPQLNPVNPEISKIEVPDSPEPWSVGVVRERASTKNRHCDKDLPNVDEDDYFRLLGPETAEGFTVESHPTLLAYIPQTSASHLLVKIIRELDGSELYQSTVPVDPKAIHAIKYPNFLDPLDVGERYRWSVSLLCESVVTPYNPMDEAVLERRSLALLPELEGQVPVERAMNLGELGIWYDMASRLYYEATDRLNSDAIANLKTVISEVGVSISETEDI